MAKEKSPLRKTPVSQLPRGLVYGLNPVREALRHGYLRQAFLLHRQDARHQEMLQAFASAGVPVEELSDVPWFEALASASHQGVAGLIRRFRGVLLSEAVETLGSGPAAAVLLDGVNDPHNLGAVIRNAAATGAAVILPKHNAPTVNCTVHKASAGYTFRTPIVLGENLSQAITYLQQHDFWIAALDAHEGESVFDFEFPQRLGLVVGSEERRVRSLLRRRSDYLLRIPMAEGVDSLNLSVAAGVVLFFHRACVQRAARDSEQEAYPNEAGKPKEATDSA